MPPPTGAAPPDNTPGEFGFDFTRFGVRVPAVLVSPLIPAGTIFNVYPRAARRSITPRCSRPSRCAGACPALTARDAAAPDLGEVLTLTTPRTDDPIAGVVAPRSSGANPAAGQVSQLLQLHAQQISNLQVPLDQLHDAPLLANQHTPADLENYIAARTDTWKAARAAGDAPGPRP